MHGINLVPDEPKAFRLAISGVFHKIALFDLSKRAEIIHEFFIT
jgi:hypothetical protein